MDENNPLGPAAAFHFKQQIQTQRIGQAFQSVKSTKDGQSNQKLQDACREMESLFLSYLLKEMRATVDKSGFISGGKAEEIFTSMLDVELSKRMSNAGGIGLSSILLRQLASQPGPKGGPSSK